ncbi:4Fe-4S dicluster domain-containing protein [Desulfovibrio sp. OttesenSCG-928-A18]|nr:4Fe-4S dicluster domain-containing protein [Desulfovibrio sp. OttesenSCG-928-A18]
MAIEQELQAAVKAALPELDCIIGWGPGPDALRDAPLFLRDAADADVLRAGFFSVNNPALFLPEYKGRKIGVLVKGCDARSVGQLLLEGLVRREDLFVIGFPCSGVIDAGKAAALIADRCEAGELRSVREQGDSIVLEGPDGAFSLAKKDVRADKCERCLFPNAMDADLFVGEKRAPFAELDEYADLAAFEQAPLEERMAFWEKEMSRCIRCYACRDACPLCVCRDQCVAVARDPHWLSQADGIRDKLFFQIIHASHLAGRCTGCGECERACPMGIPVLLLKRALSRRVETLFAYRAGIDMQGRPPLLTFSLEEPRIKERDW